jgi:CelD/BcsL family acetyltransferase involved in cellulose biosynthesis
MPEALVLEDTQDFAALEEEWEALCRDSPRATPFQSWAWLYSWWESYGGGYGLRLVAVREGDLLVGLVPLMLEHRRGLRRLLFVGTGLTDYLDIVAREGWEERVSEAAVRTLGRMGGWHVTDLQQLRPEAAAWGVFRQWEGPRARVWRGGCPVMEVKPWDELVASLSKNHRSTVRRALKRAEADGLRCELVAADDAGEAAQRLVTVNREQWRGNPLTPSEHRTRRFESHLEAAARRMLARGWGSISEFRRDREVLISTFMVFGRDFTGTYMIGASQEARQRYQWSSLYIWDALNVARSKNHKRLDLLEGLEKYKLRWNPEISPHYRLILGKRWVPWGLYSGYHILRSKAVWYARSENAPRWASDAADKYRSVRNKLGQYVGRKAAHARFGRHK